MRKYWEWRVFVLICVTLGGMGQGVVAPQLPELLGGATQQILAAGISATLMYLGIFISTFRFGKWADQGRVHWLLGPGLLLYAVTLIILGLIASPEALFGARFAEGLALSAIFVAADFVLGRLSGEKERGQWLSYYGVALSIGLLLGPLSVVALHRFPLNPSHPALTPLAVVALLALGLSIFASRLRIPPVPAANESDRKLHIGALTTAAAYGYMEASLVAVFPMLAVNEYRVSPETCLILVILTAAASSIFWGTLCDRTSPRRVILKLLFILAVGPLLLWMASVWLMPATVAYSACVVFGCLAGGLYPVGFSWLLEGLPASQYGYASGAFARYYGLGSLVGPLLAGFLCQRWGGNGLFAMVAAIGWLTLMPLTIPTLKPRDRSEAQPFAASE